MVYTKIRMEFTDAPTKGRFYRVVLVKGNPDLFKLSVMLLSAVKAEFEHCFLIEVGDDIAYVMASFMEEPTYGYKYLRRYHLSDLPDHFVLEYDTGDGWDFDCTKEEKVELDKKHDIILLEGAGYGILEDRIGMLYRYFTGKIDPNSSNNDEKKGNYLPYGFEKYGDFDKPLDIKKEDIEIRSEFRIMYHDLLTDEKEYVADNDVSLEDCYEEFFL